MYVSPDIRFVEDPREAETNPIRINVKTLKPFYYLGVNRRTVDLAVAKRIGAWESIVLDKFLDDYAQFSKLGDFKNWADVHKLSFSPETVEPLLLLTRHEQFVIVQALARMGLLGSTGPTVYESENFWIKLVPLYNNIDKMLEEAGYVNE